MDGKLVTSSGVSAALPVSLALVEAIAGPARAASLAREIGLSDWSPRHDSQAFAFGAGGYLTAAGNYLAFWRHESLALPLQPGLDEATLALRADAWARSWRTSVLATGSGPVRSLHGLPLLPDFRANALRGCACAGDWHRHALGWVGCGRSDRLKNVRYI
ncbi:hypothetical protein D9M69_529100 [compost metagenome]